VTPKSNLSPRRRAIRPEVGGHEPTCFLLLYLNTKSVAKTMLTCWRCRFLRWAPIWPIYVLGYNVSIGVWVGLIALMGVDAETGAFMLLSRLARCGPSAFRFELAFQF